MSSDYSTPKISRSAIHSRTGLNDELRVSIKDNEKVHKKGHGEYHCLGDVCILVRVPSSTTYLSRLSTIQATPKLSDASLEAYAKQAEERERMSQDPTVTGSSSSTGTQSLSDDVVNDEGYYQKGETVKNEGSLVHIDAVDCTGFMDTVAFAKDLVRDVISESEANVKAQLPATSPDSKEECRDKDVPDNFMHHFKESLDFDYIEEKRSFSSWPTIETFTVETGAYKIDEYLSSFETDEDWMYVIYYQGEEETPCSDMYRYQAIFSLPTWRYPIAQATASIYFTIEVCKVKPPHCSVNVTYKYETLRLVRKPGITDFQEKWLQYILDSKIKLFKSVTY